MGKCNYWHTTVHGVGTVKQSLTLWSPVVLIRATCLTAADVGPDLVYFLDVCKVSLEICLLHLFTLWKSSTWSVDPTNVLFTPQLCPIFVLAFRMAFSSFIVIVYILWRVLRSGLPFRSLQQFAPFSCALFRTHPLRPFSHFSQHTSGKVLSVTDKGMVWSDMSKPALIFFFPLQEYTQQNPLSKF
jgi:hypothetical protein